MGAAIELSDDLPESVDSTEGGDGGEAKQQYEGDDIGALAAAKQRMEERDAEYSKAFAKASEKKESKPAKRAESKPAKSKDVPPFAEDAPAAERKPEMTAPAVKAAEQKVRKVAADNAKAGDTKYADVKGGLRGLKGRSELPDKSDSAMARDEYSSAWKKL